MDFSWPSRILVNDIYIVNRALAQRGIVVNSAPITELKTFDYFAMLDLRVGKITWFDILPATTKLI